MPFRWRVGVDVRSSAVGAAAAFERAVDWDDVPALPVPGLVEILSTWIWQESRETRWWLGAVLEARSAIDAAHRVSAGVAERIHGSRTSTVAVVASASAGDADDDLDLQAIPGSTSPFVVPVEARAYARVGDHLTVEWTSPSARLACVTLELTESLVIGLFEHRSPLAGPGAIGLPMNLAKRHAVVRVGDVPAHLQVLDRYSGTYLPQGNDHSETQPIDPVIWSDADGPGVDP